MHVRRTLIHPHFRPLTFSLSRTRLLRAMTNRAGRDYSSRPWEYPESNEKRKARCKVCNTRLNTTYEKVHLSIRDLMRLATVTVMVIADLERWDTRPQTRHVDACLAFWFMRQQPICRSRSVTDLGRVAARILSQHATLTRLRSLSLTCCDVDCSGCTRNCSSEGSYENERFHTLAQKLGARKHPRRVNDG